MNQRIGFQYTALLALLLAHPVPAQTHKTASSTTAAATTQTAPAQPETASTRQTTLTVAILDFDASAPGNPDLGRQISETLTATLSGEPGFTLVDRSTLARTLQEHELNLTGAVSTEAAIKVGNLVGARILITGKVFTLDKSLFMTAKLIGTETSLVDGILVKGDENAGTGELLMKLSDKISSRLREAGPRLVAQPDAGADPLPALKKALAGRKLPIVAVHINETHVAAIRAAGIDPAVETEVRQLLSECGFTVIVGDERDQAAAGVSVVVEGEAFSEFSARIGNLVSCSARVEIKVKEVKTGKLLLSDRETTRAVDLAENTAGKTALQKAGRALGIRILQQFADTLPKAEGKKK
jgi:TolB-like protein